MNNFLQIKIDEIASFDTIYKNRIKSYTKSIEEKNVYIEWVFYKNFKIKI